MRIESRPARLGLTAALLLLTILVVAVSGLSMGRKVTSFQPTGVVVVSAGEELRVVSASTGSDLLPGDVIVLANGEPPHSIDDLERLLGLRQTSELEVLRETGDGLTLVSAVHPLPGLVLDWPWIALSLTGIAYLLIGLYTVSRQRSRQTLLFHVWAVVSAALYLVTPLPPYDALDRVFYLVDEACRLLLPPLTLHFFLVFPARPDSLRVRRATPWLYLPAAVLLTLQIDQILGAGRLAGGLSAAALERQDRIELLLLVGYALAAAAVLGWRLLSRRDWEQGRQAQWIAFGVAGGYVPFLLLYVVPFALELRAPAWLDVVAVAPLALVPLGFAWALLRYRLWDVAVVARDIGTWALTVLLSVLGFTLLSLMIRRGTPEDMVVARGFLNAGALLVVGTLSVPVKQGIGKSLQRLQYRTRRSRRALKRLGDELLHERDLGRLAASLLHELEEALGLERCNLFLVEGGRLLPVREEPASPVLELPEVDDATWTGSWRALTSSPLADADDRARLRLAVPGYRYIFPLEVRRRRIGLLYVSSHVGGAPLSSDDLSLVRQLLNQAVLAIENAQLLEQRQRQLNRVSELKQFNDEIIESSPAGIAVVDEQNRIVTANGAFAAAVGLGRGSASGSDLGDLLPLHLLPEQDEPSVEVRFGEEEPGERYLQLSVAAFRGAAPGHRVVVAQDVTERVTMKRALAESDRLAALGAMAAGVAHEVNTPLTGISSYAQMLLAETSARDPRRRLLRKVERQTFRAARIVNTLLDFARRGRHETAPVDLAVVIQESCDALAERFAETRVDLRVDVPPGGGCWVAGNDTELSQVLVNLMINALDAMTEGAAAERKLSIALCAAPDSISLAVDDTGPGIPEHAVDRVFEPFFSTRKAVGGTGLGLSISQEIVRRHAGDLSVSNLEPSGCRFTLRLPRMKTAGRSSRPKEIAP